MIFSRTYVSLFLCAFNVMAFAQGIVNDGARIVLSGAANIYIDGGASGGYLSQNNGLIDPSATGVISLEGDWTNNAGNTGFSSDNGTTVLLGANQSINGTSSTTFYNLTLQGSGTKTQNLTTSVGGVSTTNGVLSVGNVIYDLNSNVLVITNGATSAITYGSGYIVSETNAAVNPSVIRWNMGATTGSHIFPFGVSNLQIPVTFNKTTAGVSDIDISTRSTAASDNLPWAGASNVGAVTFFNCPNNSMTGNNCATNSVIDRWWDITPSAAVTANVTFSYRGSENTLNFPYNVGTVGAQWWTGIGWAQDNATTGSALAITSALSVGNVTANNLSTFCPFVLSSSNVPLPVEVVQMDLKCSNSGNLISWATASESNSMYFSIERSDDAIHFTELGQLNAAGNSKQKLSYSFTDLSSNENETIFYYRVKEVDINGNIKKYNILSTANCDQKQSDIRIANTPDGKVFVTLNSQIETEYTLAVYNLLGTLVKEQKIIGAKGLTKIQLDTQGIQQSVYLLKINGNNTSKNQKVAIAQP
jgi:hypothetical protein